MTIEDFKTPFSTIDRRITEKVPAIKNLALSTNRIYLTFIEHCNQHQKNICSFHLPTEHIPSWAIRQTSTNLNEVKQSMFPGAVESR